MKKGQGGVPLYWGAKKVQGRKGEEASSTGMGRGTQRLKGGSCQGEQERFEQYSEWGESYEERKQRV